MTSDLHKACFDGDLEAVRALVFRGSQINARDRWGLRPLHYACIADSLAIVELLLDRGAWVNVYGGCGRTPLHEACARCSLRVVRRLLLAGADPRFVDGMGMTPLISLYADGREHPDDVDHIASLVFCTSVWRCAAPIKVPFWNFKILPLSRETKARVVWTRRTRDLLRPLIDPNRKRDRPTLFEGSPLLRLPWHLCVDVLGFLVLGPIHQAWGKWEWNR